MVAVAVDDRAVVIAAVVGVGVMAAVVGDPGEQRALKRHGADGAEQISDPGLGLKALVREIAVEADARAHADDEVAEDERDDLHDVDGVGAEPEDAGHGTGEGKADQKSVVDPLLECGATGNHAGRPDHRAGWLDREIATSNPPFLYSLSENGLQRNMDSSFSLGCRRLPS